jgi:hypothetical protein
MPVDVQANNYTLRCDAQVVEMKSSGLQPTVPHALSVFVSVFVQGVDNYEPLIDAQVLPRSEYWHRHSDAVSSANDDPLFAAASSSSTSTAELLK